MAALETKMEAKTEAKSETKKPVGISALEEVEAFEYAHAHSLFVGEPPYHWKSDDGKFAVYTASVPGGTMAWWYKGHDICKFEWPELDLFEQADKFHEYLRNCGEVPDAIRQEWVDDWNGYLLDLAEAEEAAEEEAKSEEKTEAKA